MALGNNTTKEALADAFGDLGNWIAVYTSGGTTEATGGGYARKQTTWAGGATDGVITGSQVEIDLAAGTYTHIGVFAASSGGTVIEKATITSTEFGATGKLLVTPVFSIT